MSAPYTLLTATHLAFHIMRTDDPTWRPPGHVPYAVNGAVRGMARLESYDRSLARYALPAPVDLAPGDTLAPDLRCLQ